MKKKKKTYVYDFYFNDHFIKRCSTKREAERMITWSKYLKYPDISWKIIKIELSTEKNLMRK